MTEEICLRHNENGTIFCSKCLGELKQEYKREEKHKEQIDKGIFTTSMNRKVCYEEGRKTGKQEERERTKSAVEWLKKEISKGKWICCVDYGKNCMIPDAMFNINKIIKEAFPDEELKQQIKGEK